MGPRHVGNTPAAGKRTASYLSGRTEHHCLTHAAWKGTWLSSWKPCCRCPGTPVEARIPVSVSRPSGSSFLNLPTPSTRWGRAQAVTTLLGSCHLEAKYRGLFRPRLPGVSSTAYTPHLGVSCSVLMPRREAPACCIFFMFTQHISHWLDDIPSAWQSPVQSLLFLQNHLR